MCNFRHPNLVTFYFYELTHILDWVKNTLLFICSTNIVVCLLTVSTKNCLTPKNPKMCDPILVTLLKMRPHYSQSSRENATPSSGTSPLASYKEEPHPGLPFSKTKEQSWQTKRESIVRNTCSCFFLELLGMPVRKLLVNTKSEMIVISGIHFRLVSSRIFFKFFAPVWLHDNFILNQIKIFCVNDTKRGLDWTLNPPLHIHTQLCSWIQIQQSPDLALVWQLLFLKSDNNTDEYQGSYSFFAVPTCLKHY